MRVLFDENLPHDLIRTLTGHDVVVVVRARSNRMADLLPLVPALLDALGRTGPGRVEHVGANLIESTHGPIA